MSKVVVSADVSDKRVLTLSDNQGNQLRVDGGFVDAKCASKHQDVNVGKLSAMALQAGINLSAALPPMPPVKGSPEKQESYRLQVATGLPRAVDDIKKQMPDAVFAALASADKIHVDVTLKEGLPSPLTQLCKIGKEAKILRDR
jgi:hypothetical protein